MATSNIIKSELKGIADEVRELHPLLESLYRAMPTIETVQYTHGPNEKGADFLLTRHAVESGTTDHIGVVVKCGNLNKSSRSTSDQISECLQRRLVDGGKKQIYLDEIWVTCNGSISNGMQEKIHHEYKASKVKFFDLDRLTTLIDQYVPNFATEIAFADAEYLSTERARAIELESNCSLVPTADADIYLEQDLVLQHVDEYGGIELDSTSSNILKVVEETPVIFIEGSMGGGKSKLMAKLVKELTDQSVYMENKMLPHLKSCKDLLNEGFEFEDLIRGLIKSANFEDDPDRKYVIIFDGLDEIEKNDEVVGKRVEEIIIYAREHRDIRVVFTSRPLKNKELIETFSSVNQYELQPLSLTKIIRFIQTVCGSANVENRLLEDLKSSQLFRALPNTPIAAILLANLIKEGVDELPYGITDLYTKYTELALGRWDITKGLLSQKEFEAGIAILANIANYFMQNQLSMVAEDEAIGFFKSYLKDRNLQIDAGGLYSNIIDRSGIVYADSRERTFGFKHRSFLQYFYAKYLYSKSQVVLDQRIFQPYWNSSYFFYFGLRKDCPELIDEVQAIPVPEDGAESYRFLRLANFGSLMLAASNSPYTSIERGIQFIFSEAASFFNDIHASPSKHTLAKFPSLHLLSLFRLIIYQEYSFHFFSKAITDRLLSIDPNDKGIDPFELFFLDVTREDLAGEPIFDNLVTIYGNRLPMVLQIALQSASKSKRYESTALKSLVKKSRKRLATSGQLKAQFRQLAFKSIDGTVDTTTIRAERVPSVSKRKTLRAKRKGKRN